MPMPVPVSSAFRIPWACNRYVCSGSIGIVDDDDDDATVLSRCFWIQRAASAMVVVVVSAESFFFTIACFNKSDTYLLFAAVVLPPCFWSLSISFFSRSSPRRINSSRNSATRIRWILVLVSSVVEFLFLLLVVVVVIQQRLRLLLLWPIPDPSSFEHHTLNTRRASVNVRFVPAKLGLSLQ